MAKFAVGIDFGTESVRVLVVDAKDGRIVAQAAQAYAHGVIDDTLPTSGKKLPPDYALQHPFDWLNDSAKACRKAVKASGVSIDDIVGVGVDFTSCTMLPCLNDGTPLCMVDGLDTVPLAWPKLWKHHGAKRATTRINQIAKERNEKWLDYYGGVIGLEWFFPKILETLQDEPKVYNAAEVWIEAGDWYVWQLVSGPYPECSGAEITRSTCQAGYKAMWNSQSGYPSPEYFAAVHPKLKNVVQEKMPGTLRAPGQSAGALTPASAKLLGLRAGTPVSAAIIDAHSGVPGAGVAEDSTLVMVLGTSSCHMLNSKTQRAAPGIAGVVKDGILPGFFGYETGQASVGDAFAWLVETFDLSHEELSKQAALLPPGSNGVIALDWLNGCRTPLMDASLSGAFIGLKLNTTPAQLYRALIEATAFGVRWIVDTLKEGGVPVKRFVASGGLPDKSPLLMQIYADVLGTTITLAESNQSVALGAAILGRLAASEGEDASKVIRAMARQRKSPVYKPDAKRAKAYDALYGKYRLLGDPEGPLTSVMRSL